MTGAEFEHYVGQVLYENGHHAAVTKASGDYGVDLVLNGEIAVQVKFYSVAVGPGAVQEVVAGRYMYGCCEAWVVTNSTFTRAATALAQANGVRLIAGQELEWMADNPDRSADHRDRYEASLAAAKAVQRAKERAAMKEERAAMKELRKKWGIRTDRRSSNQARAAEGGGITPQPPSFKQRITDMHASREAEAAERARRVRAQQIADLRARFEKRP